LCDRPGERAPRRQDGVALAMLVPGLAARIALSGASCGAVLDHACFSQVLPVTALRDESRQ
jgi:hypothetical protein